MSKMNKKNNNMKSPEQREHEEELILQSRDPSELLLTDVEDAKQMMSARYNAKPTNLDKKRVVNDTVGENK